LQGGKRLSPKLLFDKGQKNKKQHDASVDELYRQIGQLKVENDFLSKGLGLKV
jgi:transposase